MTKAEELNKQYAFINQYSENYFNTYMVVNRAIVELKTGKTGNPFKLAEQLRKDLPEDVELIIN
jgi:hypothetical protein